jgi:hypothetical protein
LKCPIPPTCRGAFLKDGPFARITRGAPVVTTPEEIDITNTGQLRAALLHAAGRPGRRGRHDPDPVLRLRWACTP